MLHLKTSKFINVSGTELSILNTLVVKIKQELQINLENTKKKKKLNQE